jgi:transposase-like protein
LRMCMVLVMSCGSWKKSCMEKAVLQHDVICERPLSSPFKKVFREHKHHPTKRTEELNKMKWTCSFSSTCKWLYIHFNVWWRLLCLKKIYAYMPK